MKNKPLKKNTFCSYCGTRFEEMPSYDNPIVNCIKCEQQTYLNPSPVVVIVLPINGGVMLIRRSGGKRDGKLALPGGYIEFGERWQEAGVREIWEETGIDIDVNTLRSFDTFSTPDGKFILIFGVADPILLDPLPPFPANHETSERVIVYDMSVPIAFDLHANVLARYFASMSQDS